ncbi:MAG: hypothetical protein Ct9H90mP14_2500 [Methanobacteriota archaeon]|nr:MAG: hypothetical protein Ct9H90mP14_2500 [Euryarchaeota archaeon]
MEVGFVGGDNAAKLEWAKERLGGEITVAEFTILAKRSTLLESPRVRDSKVL